MNAGWTRVILACFPSQPIRGLEMTAQMYSDNAWGPWGPGYGFAYGPMGW
jgi:hypothetical protein